MKVYQLIDDYDIKDCSFENEFGWFWCLDERYIPGKSHGGCHRIYRIFRVRLKKDNSENFVVYNSNGEPIIDDVNIESLYIKIDLYDFKMRYQG